jgi:uncharacterized protein (PEP-CTERM system associated)
MGRSSVSTTWKGIALFVITISASSTAIAQTAPLAPAAAAPSFRFEPRGSVSFTYTDNVLLTELNRKPDAIVAPTAGFLLINKTSRTNISANADISYDLYQAATRLNAMRGSAIANGHVDLIDDYVTIDAHAGADSQRASAFAGEPASDRSFGPNQTQVISYGATPTFNMRMGNIANVVTSYDIDMLHYIRRSDPTLTLTLPLNQSIEQKIRTTVSSGSYFDLFTWQIDGSLQRTDRGGPNSASEEREASASMYFALYPNFRLSVTGGYDDERQPTLPKPTSGARLTAGFDWSLSRRTQITFDGGMRYRDPYFSGKLRYGLGKNLVLNISYTQTIDTPQSIASRNLSGVIRGDNGELLDPITGLPAGLADDPFGINSQAFVRKALEFGLDGKIGRTSYNLSGIYERRVGASTSESLSGNIELSRPIGPHLTGLIGIDYERVKNQSAALNRISETVETNVKVNYDLGKHTALSLAYYFQRRHAAPTRSRENTGVLTVTRRF